MSPPKGGPQPSPISGSRDFLVLKPNARDLELLNTAHDDGIKRGVSLLAKFTCDVESIVWSGLSSAASVTSGAMTYGLPESTPSSSAMGRASTNVGDVAYGGVSGFLEWAYGKVVEKIKSNEWIQRVTKVFGIGLKWVLDYVKKLLLSKELIQNLIPLYGPIKGLIDTGIKIYDAASASNALNRIAAAAAQIGSGLPTLMFEHLKNYLSREVVVNAGKAVYTFGKSLATILVSVFAAPAATALSLVTSVVEAVSSFVSLVYQGLTFKGATDKAREWVRVGNIAADLDLSEGVAACPFLGCLFFGAANYMGHFNLSAMMTKPALLTSANLSLAVGEVSAVQKVACEYVKSTSVPFKVIDSKDEWIIKMMKGYASNSPRSEFLTENASAKTKFKHYGKIGLRRGGKIVARVYSFLS